MGLHVIKYDHRKYYKIISLHKSVILFLNFYPILKQF